MSKLDDLIEVLGDLRGQPLQEILYEIEKLYAIKQWAIKNLGLDYAPGDRVMIVDPPVITKTQSPGWWHYREALAAGQTGVAGEISFSIARECWYVDLAMDRTWSVHEEQGWGGRPGKITRYWNGSADETPEGMTPPSEFDQKRYPGGRVKTFMLRADRLAKVV